MGSAAIGLLRGLAASLEQHESHDDGDCPCALHSTTHLALAVPALNCLIGHQFTGFSAMLSHVSFNTCFWRCSQNVTEMLNLQQKPRRKKYLFHYNLGYPSMKKGPRKTKTKTVPISGPTLDQPPAALYQTHNRHKQPQQRKKQPKCPMQTDFYSGKKKREPLRCPQSKMLIEDMKHAINTE